MKYLIFDATNILHRTFFVHKIEDNDTISGLAVHAALMTLNKYYKKYRPDKVVMCFDRSNWRKYYTQDAELCLSGRVYKANRRQKMTPAEKKKYAIFQEHVKEFEDFLRTQTAIITLSRNLLEADDIIAGIVQEYPQDVHTIVSADKDLMQLIGNNVTLIDPASGNPRTCDDVEWFLFEKCIRGDAGDNVRSSYPRVRKTRLEKAYADDYEMMNLMNETWTDERSITNTVKDLYNENKLLMDLSAQPDEIKSLIRSTIANGMGSYGSFNYFNFLQYLGKHDLNAIADSAEQFVPMLS